MKKFLRRLPAIFIFFAVAAGQASVARETVKKAGPHKIESVPGEFVIQMKKSKGGSLRLLQSELARIGMQVAESINSQEDLYLARDLNISAKKRVSVNKRVAQIQSLRDVLFAEPNFLYRTLGAPSKLNVNDPSFDQLWAMKNSGQGDFDGTLGKVGADIKATEAWDIGTGSKDVVVAVIDTGVDYNHPDLKDNIWSMPGQPEVHGYNAITDKLDPMDDNNHGTHCAGTIGAVGNNEVGVVGVNWKVSIMAAKFLAQNGSGSLANAVKAIDWAVANGAQVLSNSWGGGGFSQALKDSIARASERNVIFVAAAGNESSNNDNVPTYPASYGLSNMVVVAASTNLDGIASFSNYGEQSVDLMAPGHNILSTIPNNRYDTYSGTSMATPHVSGALALLLSNEPKLQYWQLKTRLHQSSDKFKHLRRKVASAGRLNLYNLLANIEGPGFIEVPDSAWSPLVPNRISSAHPYRNAATQRWTIEHPGATHMRVHFSRFNTEATYDTVKVINGTTGEVIDTLSGAVSTAFWSSDVEGSKIIIELESDVSVNAYGFDIDGYTWTNFQ